MPMRRRAVRIALSVLVTIAAPALAADPDAFLAGTSRNCAECDFAGRDLKERDLKRAKLDRAKLANADLAGASLFRASLVGPIFRRQAQGRQSQPGRRQWADFPVPTCWRAALEADLASANRSGKPAGRKAGRPRLNQASLRARRSRIAAACGRRFCGRQLKEEHRHAR